MVTRPWTASALYESTITEVSVKDYTMAHANMYLLGLRVVGERGDKD